MSQLPKDFFDKEADGKAAQKVLAKKLKNPVKEEDHDKEWDDFQKEIEIEIKQSTSMKESELKSQELQKRADQAYEQLQYEKRILKLLSKSSEIPQAKISKKKSTKMKLPVKKKLKLDIEPDTFQESD